jgi:hypothetical protein
MAVAIVLWTVAVMVQIFHGNPDGWVDAGAIVGILSIIPIYIDQRVEERRAK